MARIWWRVALKTMKNVLSTAQDLLGNNGYVMYNGDWYSEDDGIMVSALVPGIPTPQGVGIDNDDIYVNNYPLNEPWYAEAIEGNTEEILQPDETDVCGFVLSYTDKFWR